MSQLKERKNGFYTAVVILKWEWVQRKRQYSKMKKKISKKGFKDVNNTTSN